MMLEYDRSEPAVAAHVRAQGPGGETLKFESIIAVFKALDDAGVRFLVAGGVAVNLHGYARMTQDLDLVVELSPENAHAAMRALAGLGYRPRVPVSIESFADPAQRRNWIENKHMQVFPLFSDTCPETNIDVFVTEPFIFDEEYQGADRYTLQPGVVVRTVTPETLISMKRIADRDRDRDDIKHLQWIIEERLKEKDDD